MNRILLVENDAEALHTVARCCATLGAELETVTEANTTLWQQDWAFVMLSATLPDVDGLTLLRQLRTVSRVPVLLFVTPDNEVDGILGLELGADVYLTKPLNPRRLLAQMRALLRRTHTEAHDLLPPPPLQRGKLKLDEQSHVVCYAEKRLELTASEFELMRMLMRANGEAISREDLSLQLLGRPFQSTDRSLDVHVSNLRRKLAEATQQPDNFCIRAVRGVGYVLTLR
jgi:DNA-binding response OmpR family regulator